MRDADDPDDGGRIPPRRSMGGSGTPLKGVSQSDFNEFREAADKKHGMLKAWLGWMTAFVVVLSIALFISVRVVWYQGSEIDALTQTVNAQKDLLGVKADVAAIVALSLKVDTVTVAAARAEKVATAARAGVAAVDADLADVVAWFDSENYITSGQLNSFRDDMQSQLSLFESRVTAVLPSIMPRVEERLTERLAQFRSEELAARDALRASADRQIEGMKWQNRLAVGLGVVNTVVWGIHIAPDAHHGK